MRQATWSTILLTLALILTGCSAAETRLEEWRVQRTVEAAINALVEGLNSRNLSHAVATYFATPSEGADPQEIANLVDPLAFWIREHFRDATQVQLASMEVGSVRVEGDGKRATASYRIRFQRTLAGLVEAEVEADGTLRLMKLPRGWVIIGSSPPQIIPLMGTTTF